MEIQNLKSMIGEMSWAEVAPRFHLVLNDMQGILVQHFEGECIFNKASEKEPEDGFSLYGFILKIIEITSVSKMDVAKGKIGIKLMKRRIDDAGIKIGAYLEKEESTILIGRVEGEIIVAINSGGEVKEVYKDGQIMEKLAELV